MYKKMGVALVVFSFITVTAPGGVVSNVRQPFGFDVYNECTGEYVALEGMVHLLTSLTIAEGGRFQYTFHLNSHAEGIGWDSGNRYIWNDRMSDKETGTGPTSTYVGRFFSRLISQGDLPNEDSYWKFKISCDHGDCTILVDEFRITCKGGE